MTRPPPSFTIGVEEEYLLVDPVTRDVVSDPPRQIFKECAELAGEGLVEPELLRAQIEVDTKVCQTVAEARDDLARLRHIVHEVANRYHLRPIAASTHPFASWHNQQHTPKERYRMLSRDMQSLARRMLICGMHVHVGIEDDELRIAMLNQFTHFLPLLLALSTSSPFWEGENTGLMSYRLTVFDNFPRTGLPEYYPNYSKYRQHVDILEKAEVIKDATLIWWDLRPSERYPTLEMRITDVCTQLDDAIALAAFTQCILHHMSGMHKKNMNWQVYSRFLIDQNRWRAMRYGIDKGLVDFTTADIVPINVLVEDLLELVHEDAVALNCTAELNHVLKILQRGTSAHQQIKTYEDAISDNTTPKQALNSVVDMLIEQTIADF